MLCNQKFNWSACFMTSIQKPWLNASKQTSKILWYVYYWDHTHQQYINFGTTKVAYKQKVSVIYYIGCSLLAIHPVHSYAHKEFISIALKTYINVKNYSHWPLLWPSQLNIFSPWVSPFVNVLPKNWFRLVKSLILYFCLLHIVFDCSFEHIYACKNAH